MDAPAEIRIVLLGKTGSGKSSAGNVILGQEKFKVLSIPNSVTRDCQTEEANINHWKIKVTDTPGIFDTDKNRSDEDLKYSIISCLADCAPGPHAFILVLKVGRYTKEEKESVKMMLEWFKEDTLKHTVILFTRGNELEEDQNIKQFAESNKDLKNLVHKCGDRVHVIDSKRWGETVEPQHEKDDENAEVQKIRLEKREAGKVQAVETLDEMINLPFEQRSSTPDQEPGQRRGRPTSSGTNLDGSQYRNNRFQRNQLLITIDNMVKGNRDSHYTNESLQLIAEAIEKEIKNIEKKRSSEENEIWNQAQNRIINPDHKHPNSEKAIQEEVMKIKNERKVQINQDARRRIMKKILVSDLAGAAAGYFLGLLVGFPFAVGIPFVQLAGALNATRKLSLRGRPATFEVTTSYAIATIPAIAGLYKVMTAGINSGEKSVTVTRAVKEATKAIGKAGLSSVKEVWDFTQIPVTLHRASEETLQRSGDSPQQESDEMQSNAADVDQESIDEEVSRVIMNHP